MDEVRKKLHGLRSEKDNKNERKPSLVSGIAAIDQQIVDLEKQLTEKLIELADQKKVAASQPVPTLLEDALGSNQSLEKHRLSAIQNYRVHKFNADIQQSRDKQQKLRTQRVALAQTTEMLQTTLSDNHSKVKTLTDSKIALELQFTELSAAIVQKQDRHDQHSKRLAALKLTPQQARFATHRGELRDPTIGVLQRRYAEPKAQGLLKWEGILIATPQEQTIEAVFDGTVVFADHMQGFGDVAILDHGEGYMSLYGMADFLVVEPGQQVIIGDIIGTVGGSIGNDESTLYFEIRHDATTLNPMDWLSLRRISQDIEP